MEHILLFEDFHFDFIQDFVDGYINQTQLEEYVLSDLSAITLNENVIETVVDKVITYVDKLVDKIKTIGKKILVLLSTVLSTVVKFAKEHKKLIIIIAVIAILLILIAAAYMYMSGKGSETQDMVSAAIEWLHGNKAHLGTPEVQNKAAVLLNLMKHGKPTPDQLKILGDSAQTVANQALEEMSECKTNHPEFYSKLVDYGSKLSPKLVEIFNGKLVSL